MIEGPPHFRSAQERKAGFLAALPGPMPDAYLRKGDYGFESGLSAAEALLSLEQPPTAIFACNDIMAAAVLKAAREQGVDVPGQLSVAGFDGSDLAAMITPSLTTIRRPLTEMARMATESLLAMIDDPNGAQSHEPIALSLIQRQSVAAPR
jgi:LacI family transcriptional regulator